MAKAIRSKKRETAAAVTQWLVGYRHQRVILFFLGSVGTLLLSIPVLILTWWAIWMVLLLVLLMIPGSLQMHSTATWVGLGLIFVAHLTTNQQQLESLKFDPEGPGLTAAKFAARVAGMHSLSLFMAGPNTLHSQIKMIGLILLTGPALIGLSWRLAKAGIAASRMDIQTVGEALAILLDAGTRVLVDDLARQVGTPNPPQLLRELLLIDGVTLLTTGDPSLTTTDSLRSDVSAALERNQE